MYEKALEFAAGKHFGQKRWNGDEYITHPIRVSKNELIKYDENAQIAALLHDTIEDTNTTYDEISEKFGSIVANMVELLTKYKNESYAEYIMTLGNSGNLSAIRVKLCDLEDNLSNIRNGSMKDKYELSKLILQEKLDSC